MSPVPRARASRATTHEVRIATPYRLDLTVSALRRTSTNLVDVYTPDGRYVRALGAPTESDGVPLVVFPGVQQFLGADDAVIRAAGLSASKLATLRRAGEAIASGALSEAMLDERSSADAALALRGIKGIGPWTATVILLRGLGRLDVFPGGDSGVAANLALIADGSADAEAAAETLGSQRGMLYFNLLLARLEARGEIGRPSVVSES